MGRPRPQNTATNGTPTDPRPLPTPSALLLRQAQTGGGTPGPTLPRPYLQGLLRDGRAAAQAQAAQAAQLSQAAARQAIAAHKLQALRRRRGRGRRGLLPPRLLSCGLLFLVLPQLLRMLQLGCCLAGLGRRLLRLPLCWHLLLPLLPLRLPPCWRRLLILPLVRRCVPAQQRGQSGIGEGCTVHQFQPYQAAAVGCQQGRQLCVREEGAAHETQPCEAAQACSRRRGHRDM